jgi:hypothetical protein
MHAIRKTVLAVVLGALAALSTAAAARADYAAIAYSPATGEAGYAYNAPTKSSAMAAALANCDHLDAEVLVVAEDAYVALAVSPDGYYGYAWGTDQDIAEGIALEQ